MTETTALDKDKLLRTAMRHLSREMWERGDGDRYPWVWTELDAIEQEFDELTKDELCRRLRLLYKQIAARSLRPKDGEVTISRKIHSLWKEVRKWPSMANSRMKRLLSLINTWQKSRR